MTPDVYLVVLPNKTPENTNKRKEILVDEVEHVEPTIQRRVRGRFVDEIDGEEEESRSPLPASVPLRKTSIWRTIELRVTDLEEKLDASIVRERKLKEELAYLKEELADLKVKFGNDIAALEAKAQFTNKIHEIESKLKEAQIEINWLAVKANLQGPSKVTLDLTSCVSYDPSYIMDQIEVEPLPGPTELSLGHP
ncbi:hypothetical protein RIF29_31077 [Crotalaria pallida]|uniref:Uncharacterized protein n=1 Tax=Crotalaria pallida TaxID=3830 RepID=A0AAN9HXC5_CROPI